MQRFLWFSLGLVGVALIAVAWLGAGNPSTAADAPPPAKADGKSAEPAAPKVDFARQVLPILATNCFTCHGQDEKRREAGLRLDLAADAIKELEDGEHAIVPGKPDASALVKRIFLTNNDRMPPPSTKHELKPAEKDLLKRWIAEGAEYRTHWAFVAPKRPPVPEPKKSDWARNPIDRFILARLETEKLEPSPEVDRYALARRAAIDLTGLPPTLEAADKFAADKQPDAYERYVDELLASPSYGERWAHVWLDLARYADSNGYGSDYPRTIWSYRDWVVEALNANMPYNQFTIEQLGGDLMPNATRDQQRASAFQRNTPSNDENGTVDEEFRVAAVLDRVATTMQVWMGLTMQCAQCHDHKYDPLLQEDFYRMFAIFNQTEDTDSSDNSPLLTYYSPEDEETKKKLEAEIASYEQQIKEAQVKWEKETPREKLPRNMQAIVSVIPDRRSERQKTDLQTYFLNQATELKDVRDQLKKAKDDVAAIVPITLPIMKELPADSKKRRKSYILIRGDYLSHDREVQPGLPALFGSVAANTPINRLTVGQWIVSPENPLTARVAVNRFWAQIFGTGLVETMEDFGIRSQAPSHPELLDWLATEFVAEGWDVKKLLKMLVTSATYRQSSRVTPQLLERDPNNRLLARGPRVRGTAEVVRDQALFAAGLLSPKMFGPPVHPPRPKFNLIAAFGATTDWETSTGEDRYRRALYTEWRRTTPYPSMTTFDAPNRNVCTNSRPRTNTPLQALVTLNDPVYVEAAQALARRMMKDGGDTPESRAKYGFRLCLTRNPTDAELKRIVELYSDAKIKYQSDPGSAGPMAMVPLGPITRDMDVVDAAAWTVTANVLLNLDELFAKR